MDIHHLYIIHKTVFIILNIDNTLVNIYFIEMSRAVLGTFEEYQKERVKFVQTIAELARQPQNVEALQAAGNY